MNSSQPTSRVDLASAQIISLIQKKNLQPGDRLPNEQKLSSLLNIGRGTLREAIKQLVTRNILVVRQGSGTYVCEHMGVPEDPLGLTFIKKGPELAISLVELRLMIEPEMAALAAERITPEQKKELINRCSSLEQLLNAGENYINADALFHCYIAECSGNKVLQNLMPTIITAVSLSIEKSGDGFRTRSAYEHHCILDAICRNDSLGARYSMITHLNVTRDYFARQEYLSRMVWNSK